MKQVFRLTFPNADGFAVGVVSEDEEYSFFSKFLRLSGQKIGVGWNPPEVEVSGSAESMKDFNCFGPCVPAVSERVRRAIEASEWSGDVEFLPLTRVNGQWIYALNVLRRIACLDAGRSELRYSASDPRRIAHVSRYVFRTGCDKYYMFQLAEEEGSPVFVTLRFLEWVMEHSFTGVGIEDPERPFSQFNLKPWDGSRDDLARFIWPSD